jgi:hypothetical protein
MHEVASRFYNPNSADQSSGNPGTFGTTTNIINGGIECGKGYETQQAQNRANNYSKYLSFFGTSDPYGGFGCKSNYSFPSNGWGAQSAGFVAHSYGECWVVDWDTKYTLWATNDYKRCVCDSYGATGCMPGLGESAFPEPEVAQEETQEIVVQ